MVYKNIKSKIKIVCMKGHYYYLPLPAPALGDLQFCFGCDDYTPVKEIPDYWYAKCNRRHCFEEIRLTDPGIMVVARSHAKRKRHVVVVRHQETVVREYDPIMETWVERLSLEEMRALAHKAGSVVKSADSPDQGDAT